MKAIKKNYLTKKKKAMQIKTIEKVIINKMNEWLETITDEDFKLNTKYFNELVDKIFNENEL